MDGYNAMELDDVHRFLPSEILEDIGITAKADELCSLDTVEELAARLANVLGSTTRRSQRRTLPPPKPANSSHQRRQPTPPEVVHVQRKRAEAWLLLENGHSLPMLAPPAPRPLLVGAVPLLGAGMRSSGGTGVFLPRTGAYHHHTTRGTKPSRRRSEEEDTRMSRATYPFGVDVTNYASLPMKQQQQLRLYTHARVVGAEMEQQLRTRNSSVASHARTNELILSQEWVY